MSITNKEIAKRLNISETTLSFIINDKPGIGEKTRARVVKQIKALGYEHILKKESPLLTRSICFIAYKKHGRILNHSPFYLFLMEHIQERAKSAGYNLVFRMIDSPGSVTDEIRELNDSTLSGVLLFATEMLDEDIRHFQRLSMPVVAVDNDFTHLDMDSVVINNHAGTHKAIRHLAEAGHREIGYLQSKAYINSFGEREQGYLDALAQCGLDLSPAHRFHLGDTEEESYRDFKAILAKKTRLPSAFVSDFDTLAVGAMRALTEAGVAVPGDVSLVGFDDRPVCRFTSPPLTTISVPKDLFGSLAVDLLLERLARPRRDAVDFRKIEVGVQLILRESTQAWNKISNPAKKSEISAPA